MKPENEIKAFGFVDEMPPVPGSIKAEYIKLIEAAEESGSEYILERVLEKVKGSIDRMRNKAMKHTLSMLYGNGQ